ncbi:MAG: elongation factor G, partial [Planctomycetota bacterium]
EETGQTLLHCMGELHAEILLHRITTDFSVPARTGEPRVAFKETILAGSAAEKRHVFRMGEKNVFGHVAVEIRPSKAEVSPTVVTDLPQDLERPMRPYVKAVEDGLRSAVESGNIAGYPMIYLEVRFVGGSVAPDSAEAAYSAAAVNAFRKALQATQSAVLEPHMRFEVTAPAEYVGDVLNDLNRRGAEIQDMEAQEGAKVLRGNVPLSKMFGYATSIRSLTQGRGSHTMEPLDYRAVPEAELKQMLGDFLG